MRPSGTKSTNRPDTPLANAEADRPVDSGGGVREIADHRPHSGLLHLLGQSLKRATSLLAAIPKVFLVVIAVRLLLVVTYPINFMITDGPNMYKMLVGGLSNLVHAPGYPFLMGLIWRIPISLGAAENHPIAFQYLLCASQHAINICCLYLAYLVAKELFGNLSASLFVLIYGLHFQVLNVTSSITPEWLQGSLFMLLWYLLFRAYQTTGLAGKTLWYSLTGFVFCWMYLVKFNSIALLTLPAIVAVFDLWRSRKAWLPITTGALTAVATFAVFVIAFHQPSTGTYAISLDKSWVLLEKVGRFVPRHTLSPETGIATKRLIVLNHLLPGSAGKGPVSHIDQVPPSVRAPYRAAYLHLLTAGDAELDEILAEIEIPEPYDFSIAFLPVFHFIGYAEGNHLGVEVFVEHVRRYPKEYLVDAWNLALRTLTKPKTHWMYPMSFKGRPGRALDFGFIELKPRRKLAEEPTYRYPVPIVWGPGVKFFNLHFTMFQIPTIWIVIVVVGGAIAAARSAIRQGDDRRAATVYLALFLTIVLFILFSNFVYHFRWKEVHPIMPAVCLLVSLALLRFNRWVAGLDRNAPRQPAGSA